MRRISVITTLAVGAMVLMGVSAMAAPERAGLGARNAEAHRSITAEELSRQLKEALESHLFQHLHSEFFCPCNILGAAALAMWTPLPANCTANGTLSGVVNQLGVAGKFLPSPRVAVLAGSESRVQCNIAPAEPPGVLLEQEFGFSAVQLIDCQTQVDQLAKSLGLSGCALPP